MICDPTHDPKSKIHLKLNLYILYIFLPSFSSVYIKNIIKNGGYFYVKIKHKEKRQNMAVSI